MRNSTRSTSTATTIFSNCNKFLKNHFAKILLPIMALLLGVQEGMAQQTPYVMSIANYSQPFTNIANTTEWPNGFIAAGSLSKEWAPVAVNASGTVGDGIKITTTTATFSTSTSGGVQRGVTNIYLLSTSTANSCAIDLLLDFTGRTAGTISFNVAQVANSTGNRDSYLKLFWSTNGTTFTELTGTNLPYAARNNVASSASITTISLPSNFNGSSTARLRFYEYSTATGGLPSATGSQPKISVDNISVTSTASNSTVTYNGNGSTSGSAPVDGSSPYANGSNVTVLGAGSLLRTGYTFNGWNTAADGSGTTYAAGGTITSIAANTILYAKWLINTYTVTYNGNGSDGGTAPVDGSSPYNYGSNVTVLSAGSLTKTGFTFINWNTQADGNGTGYSPAGTITAIAANITLYAQWIDASTYAVIYSGNGFTGGTVPDDVNSPYALGSNVTILGAGTMVKTGYTFTGWNTAANGSGTGYVAGNTISNISASVTLYAQWLINTYTVIYNGNGSDGGSVPVDGSSPYNYNSTVTVLGVGSLTRTNYNFIGWNTLANGTGTNYSAGNTITNLAANVTLYAKWAIITFTLNYNGNTSTGGTAPIDGSSPYAIGSNVTVLTQGTLVKTGYSFVNWNTAADGTGTAYAAGATISNYSANTTLYARWTINSYTVTYLGNGNDGGTAPVDGSNPHVYLTTVTVLANTGNLTRTGYDFVGWAVNADGSGTNYAATGAVTFTMGANNVTLYAKWSQPLYESFTYTAGDNVGGNTSASGTANNNWTTHSNNLAGTIAVSSLSLNYNGLKTSTGNKISIPGANATVPRDINRNAGLLGSINTTYYSFLLNIVDATQLATTFGTTGNGYFVHLGATSGTSVSSFTGKVHARSSNTALNYRLGVSETGNTPTEATGDLTFGTTYLVVVKYVYNNTAGNDLATIWVNPTSLGGAEPVGGVNGPGSANVGSYNSATTAICIRNASATPKAEIDEIRAGTSWASVTPALYSVTYNGNSNTGGSVPVDGSSPYVAGSTVTVLGNTGSLVRTSYSFAGWNIAADGTGTNYSPAATFSIAANTTLYAKWTAVTYQLTVTTSTGGTITAPVSSPATVSHAAATTITATATAGYTFTGWTVESGAASIANAALLSTTVTLTSGNAAVKANFTFNTYQLTVATTTGGTITAPVSSPVTVNHGAATTITATTSTGYTFTNWTVTAGSASIASPAALSTTATLTSGNATVRANFTINTFSMTASAGANGAISFNGTVQAAYGTDLYYVITPNAGYSVLNVIVDGVSQGAISNYFFQNITAPHTISASFTVNTYTITASAGVGGSISPNGVTNKNAGTNQAYTITPNDCNGINDVLVNGISQGPITTYTFNNILANHTISVSFSTATFTQWEGSFSTDWNNPLNWSDCVPDASKFVYIPANGNLGVTQQPILTANAVTGDLEIDVNGSLTIGSNTLFITGAYYDDGNASLIGSANSNLVFNSGSTLSSANTLVLKNLTVTAGTLTLTTPVDITAGTTANTAGSVTVATGALLESDGFLTFKSNQYGTARMAANTSGSTYVTGYVTVERYIPNNGFRSWRLLAVPTNTTQTIRQAWQEGVANPNALDNNLPGLGTQITTNGLLPAVTAAGFDNISLSSSILTYNSNANSWAAVATTNTSIAANSGYFLFVRGDRSQAANVGSVNATTLRTKGSIYQGNQTSATIAAGTFGIVGNIYPSAINFTQLTRNGGVNNLFYIWDSKKLSGGSLGFYQTFSSTNSFQCLVGGGSYVLAAPNTTIESGQAFFVSANGTSGSVTFTENAKLSTSGSLGFRPTTAPADLVKIDSRLFSVGASSNTIVDANVVVFDNDYSNNVDGDDAIKFGNSGENFGIDKPGKMLAIEGRQPINNKDTIFFKMSNLKKQQYQFEFIPQNLLAQGLIALLQDSYLNNNTPVDMTAASRINFTIDANAASAAANRFRIVFTKSTPLPVSFISISANRSGNNVQVDWKLAAESGIRNYEVERSTDGRNFSTAGTVTAVGNLAYSWLDVNAAAGTIYYRIKGNSISGEAKFTNIVKVSGGNIKPGFTISPNPVEGSVVNLQFKNQPEGRYSIRLLSIIGQVVFSSNATHAGGNSTQLLNLPEGMAPGTYQLEIIAPDKTKTTQRLLMNN